MLYELIDQFLADVCAGKDNETRKAYRTKLAHLQNYLGDQEITQERTNEFKIYLLERKTHYQGRKLIDTPLSKFTVRSILATTRHLLKWSHSRGLLPEIELKNIREPTPDPKAIAEETVTRMLLAVPRVGREWEQTRNLALMYCLIDTGARVGSLARLEISNLILQDAYASSLDKFDQWNWIHFSPGTINRLRDWLTIRYTRHPTDDLLFTGHRGHGMDRQAIRRMLDRLAAAAGCEHARHNPHSFRHAFARDAILSGANLNQVAEMMNHRGIVVTHKYYARWEKLKEVKKFHRRFSPGRKLPE